MKIKILGFFILSILMLGGIHQLAPNAIPTIVKEIGYTDYFEKSLSKAIFEDLGPMDSKLVVSTQKVALKETLISHKKDLAWI